MTVPHPGSPTATRLSWLLGAGAALQLFYVLFHLWQNWPALSGAGPWLARQRHSELSPWASAALAALFLGHGMLGLWLARRRAVSAGPTADAKALSTLLPVTGLLFSLFLAAHIAHVRAWESGPHMSHAVAYQALWNDLGRFPMLLVYVVGTACMCFHFGYGASLFVARASALPAPSAQRVGRALGAVLGVALWLLWLQVTGRFAVGEALIPMGAPVEVAPVAQ